MLALMSALGGIIFVDLILSGDNALVIGAAAAGFARKQRWMIIAIGGAGAVVLRIGFTILATMLLQFPLLQAIGGVILLFIAVRLVVGREEKPAHSAKEGQRDGKIELARKGFMLAVLTILVADATMSLDNVLAIGALANGNMLALVIGLLFSVVLLMVGSALVAELVNRLPWLLYGASLLLAWTAARMLLSDIRLGPLLDYIPWSDFALPALTIGVVVACDVVLRMFERRAAHAHVR